MVFKNCQPLESPIHVKSVSSTENTISVKWSSSVGVIYYDVILSLSDSQIDQQRVQYGTNKIEFFALRSYEKYEVKIRAFYTTAVFVDETTTVRTKSVPPKLTISDRVRIYRILTRKIVTIEEEFTQILRSDWPK